MKIWWSWDIAPCILNLDTRWRQVVSFTPLPLYPGEAAPVAHCVGVWMGPRAGLGAMENRKISSLGQEPSEMHWKQQYVFIANKRISKPVRSESRKYYILKMRALRISTESFLLGLRVEDWKAAYSVFFLFFFFCKMFLPYYDFVVKGIFSFCYHRFAEYLKCLCSEHVLIRITMVSVCSQSGYFKSFTITFNVEKRRQKIQVLRSSWK
jgi:hypothetical protein